MDFGSSGWRDYFINATRDDKIGRPWSTHGQYIDNLIPTPPCADMSPTCPVKYPSSASWSSAMNGFATAVADAFAKHHVPTMANRGHTTSPAGVAAWVALDREVNAGHAPVGQMEESAFITHGPSQVNWLPHEHWKSQVTAMGQIKNSIAMMSTNKCQLVSQQTSLRNTSGTDQYGLEVDFWQVLWFALASFQLGKNEVDGNSYFSFAEGFPLDEPVRQIQITYKAKYLPFHVLKYV